MNIEKAIPVNGDDATDSYWCNHDTRSNMMPITYSGLHAQSRKMTKGVLLENFPAGLIADIETWTVAL